MREYINKGVVSGFVTVLGGVASILLALGKTPPDLLISIVTLLAGVVTTQDSVRK